MKTKHNFTLDPDVLRKEGDKHAGILAELAAMRRVSISQLIGQLAREEAARVAKSDQL